MVNGLGVTYLKIAPLVMTLGMAGVVTGLIIVITQGNVSGAIAPIMTQVIARPVFLGIPGAIVIWVVFGALMWLLLERTTFGKHLFAIGTNRITARLSGVNVTGMVLGTYALAGMLAGLGGFLVVGNTGVVHIRIGDPFLFPSIAAVAVGGTLLSGGKGSYLGTMAGRAGADADHQPADHHADARVGAPNGAGRHAADHDLDLRAPARAQAVELPATEAGDEGRKACQQRSSFVFRLSSKPGEWCIRKVLALEDGQDTPHWITPLSELNFGRDFWVHQ